MRLSILFGWERHIVMIFRSEQWVIIARSQKFCILEFVFFQRENIVNFLLAVCKRVG